MTQGQASFVSLPYDIRFLIYQHLFPPGHQIYIQALSFAPTRSPRTALLHAINPPGYSIPTNFLLTNRQLHQEASEYLYNSYLFNIVGLKPDCLAGYERLADVIRKYAREEVHVDAFSNGEHSQTMCMSLYCGEDKSDAVSKRKRGLFVSIRDMTEECRARGLNTGGNEGFRWRSEWERWWERASLVAEDNAFLAIVATAIVVAVFAYLLVLDGDAWAGIWCYGVH